MKDYTVFISYRHMPRDIAAAKAIHTKLENFAIPSHIKKTTGIKKVGRCFRDQEELPTSSDLARDILDALANSKWLVVVCTPDTQYSKWCRAEIETFVKLHGRSRVLAVLAAGDPRESFPDILLYDEAEDGSLTEREPMAADIRADSVGQMKQKLKIEKLRLLAPILGVKFDDLRRRARERVFKIALTASAAAVAVFAVFGGYASYQASVISRQNIEITQKNDELERQIIETERQRKIAVENEAEAVRQTRIAMLGQIDLLSELSKNAAADGDRIAGVHLALESADIYDAVFPAGDEKKENGIRQTLEGSVYSSAFRLASPLKNNGRKLGYAEFSPDDSLILCGLGSYNAALFDALTGEMLFTAARNRPYMDNELAFVSFSPSGEFFVTAYGLYTCEIVVWKTGAEPMETASLHVGENYVAGRFISETEIIYGRPNSYDPPAVWNFANDTTRAPSDAERAAFESNPPLMAISGSDTGLFLSPCGVFLYVNGSDFGEPARVYDIAANRCVAELDNADAVYALSNDGNRFLAGSESGFCGIYNTALSATSVTASDGAENIFAYPSYFDVAYTEELFLNSNHLYDTSFFYWMQPYLVNEPSGRFIAIIYPDSYVAVWDLEKNRTEASHIIWEHIGVISAAYMTPRHLVTAGLDGRLMVFDMTSGSLNNIIIENGIISLNLDPDGGRAVAVGRSLSCAYVYDLETGLMLYRLDAEPNDLIDYEQIGFSTDGSRVIVRTQNGLTITGKIFGTFEEVRTAAAKVYPRSSH